MARPAYLAALALAVLGLTLGACGGEDNGASSTSSSREAGAPPTSGENGATGATGATGNPGARAKRRQEPKRGASGGAAPPAAETGSTPSGSPPREQPSKKQQQPSQKQEKPEGVQYPASVGRELAKQARVVCRVMSLDVLVEQYEPKSRSPEDVGEAYAAGFPPSVRDAVAAGCAAGVRAAP